MGHRAGFFRPLGIVDAVRRAAVVHVYARGILRNADEQSLGLFDAFKRCACIGGYAVDLAVLGIMQSVPVLRKIVMAKQMMDGE